jgi:polysaccharide deacetylase family sporulation protein PdaB
MSKNKSLRKWLILGAIVVLGAGLLVVRALPEKEKGTTKNINVKPLAHPAVSKLYELPIYSVDTKEKVLAISFDASWGASRTDELLKILKNYHVKSTFFLTGIWVKQYPDKVKEILAAGHEIGNHSTTHPHCKSLSPEAFQSQLLDNEMMIEKLTGVKTTLFRPPFGEYNTSMLQTAYGHGYHVIQWSVDSLDWMNKGVAPETERVLQKAHPGAIILFHNDAEYTPQALPIILKSLQKQGYRIVPVSELLIKDDYVVDAQGVQRRAN